MPYSLDVTSLLRPDISTWHLTSSRVEKSSPLVMLYCRATSQLLPVSKAFNAAV